MEMMDWLKRSVPGFDQLDEEELSAITEFMFLWSLFEARILNTRGSANAICTAVKTWDEEKQIEPEWFEGEMAYFRRRYVVDGTYTHHLDMLYLRNNDQPEYVRSVLDGSRDTPRERLCALLIIIMRFRNNLFHGNKWAYGIAGQFSNFTNANSVLQKVLDRYGELP